MGKGLYSEAMNDSRVQHEIYRQRFGRAEDMDFQQRRKLALDMYEDFDAVDICVRKLSRYMNISINLAVYFYRKVITNAPAVLFDIATLVEQFNKLKLFSDPADDMGKINCHIEFFICFFCLGYKPRRKALAGGCVIVEDCKKEILLTMDYLKKDK